MDMSPRPYLIGGGTASDDPASLDALLEMYFRGDIDHIQVLVVPEPQRDFQARLDRLAGIDALIIVHAPHHQHGVNPCAPAAFGRMHPEEAIKHIESAMQQTFEAADALGSPYIVLHAGRYERGGKTTAIETFNEFLDLYNDPRFCLENLPSVYGSSQFIGTTAGELSRISRGRITTFCLDFAHLYCTVNYRALSYAEELASFEDHTIALHHLSNSVRGSITDQHLEIDHPEGGLDLDLVFSWIRRHVGTHTSLELKDCSPKAYLRQLAVFDRFYHNQSFKAR
jgi:endonuclease IV